VQLFPANEEQGPAAWTNNKQENEDQIQADNVLKWSGRIIQMKYKTIFSPKHGHLKTFKPAVTLI
jgi:hypothetical protein